MDRRDSFLDIMDHGAEEREHKKNSQVLLDDISKQRQRLNQTLREDNNEDKNNNMVTQFEDIRTINSEDEISDFDHMFMNRNKDKSIDDKDKMEEEDVDPQFIEAFFKKDPQSSNRDHNPKFE
jgi:hypothetical protein